MTTISALPAAPNPLTDSQATYNSKALALTQAWPTFVTETNLVAGEVNVNAGTATTKASDASGYATAASGYATAAMGYRDTAQTYAGNAASSAATAINAPGTSATSTTSLTIGTGSKSLTIQAGKSIAVGASVIVAYTTTPTTRMSGAVTSYNSGTGALVVNVDAVSGSGTQTAWTISLGSVGANVSGLATSGAIGSSGLTMGTAKILGRTTASTGAVEELTSVPVSLGGTGATTLAANNVVLGNGTSAVQLVAPSTSGNVLTSNGTTWASTAPAAGGAWVYLSTVTASAAATADFTSNINSTYANYVIVGEGIYGSSSGSEIRVEVYQSGAWTASGYYFTVFNRSYANNTYIAVYSTSASSGQISASDTGGALNDSSSLIMYLFNPSSSSTRKLIRTFGGGVSSAIDSCVTCSVAAITGVRISILSRNITGTFRLYGIKNS